MAKSRNSQRRECDVLVIGAGPAGSSAARSAALSGARVIMIDRHRRVGVPAQCAGFLPQAAVGQLAGFDLSKSVQVNHMLAFLPDNSSQEITSPGFIVNRERLDQWLAQKAEDAGVQVMTSTRALALAPGPGSTTVTAATPDDSFEIDAAVVVGADGPCSRTGASLGLANQSFVVAAQLTVPLIKPISETRIFFDRSIKGGYGWLFPAGEYLSGAGSKAENQSGAIRAAHIGAGVKKEAGANPHQALKWLLNRLVAAGFIEDRPLSVTGGLIPVGGPLNTRKDRILLAGDAAGLCHPVNGAGIWFAMCSGRLAGEAAATASVGYAGALASYAEEIEDLFGESLRAAALRRINMYEPGLESDTELSASVRQVWFAFKQTASMVSVNE